MGFERARSEVKSRNKGFDCIKAIDCVAVVLIHFNFKGETGKIVATASRFAVPVFFLSLGCHWLSFA